ncbi:MAG: CoA transferase [Rhodospirillaceae bacterium]|nr:CoA transferase [Rhodospirillaceae bacterium]|tara:strand:+ start:248 stop:1480 length:1233 start_codon:yes stop_codon:yes gene_type:complete
MSEQAKGPLTGVKVLDVTMNLAGPAAAMHLADFGADVIKVERPGRGDDTRRFVPAFKGESSSFMMINRNKRGLAIDLKSEQGKEIFRTLVKQVDVLVENFLKDTMNRLGLGYEALKEINPGLIYCGISGFGRTGPYSHLGGVDLIAQGMSGLMSTTGYGEGHPPLKTGAPICDVMTGMFGAMGVLAAVIHKRATGEGQFVDTSLMESGIAATFHQSSQYVGSGEAPEARGNVHPLNGPYEIFQTKDGWMTMAAGSDERWQRLARLFNHEEWIDDPRFAKTPERMANLDKVRELLTPFFLEKTRLEWMTLMEKAGIPAGPILDTGEMFADEQTRHRNMVVEVDHSTVGKIETLGPAVKLSKSPASVRRAAPRLGEHSAEVLAEFGYSKADIDELLNTGVIEVPEGLASAAE